MADCYQILCRIGMNIQRHHSHTFKVYANLEVHISKAPHFIAFLERTGSVWVDRIPKSFQASPLQQPCLQRRVSYNRKKIGTLEYYGKGVIQYIGRVPGARKPVRRSVVFCDPEKNEINLLYDEKGERNRYVPPGRQDGWSTIPFP